MRPLANLNEKDAVDRLRNHWSTGRTQEKVTAFDGNFLAGLKHACCEMRVNRNLKRILKLPVRVTRCRRILEVVDTNSREGALRAANRHTVRPATKSGVPELCGGQRLVQ